MISPATQISEWKSKPRKCALSILDRSASAAAVEAAFPTSD
jgi:hypothetical protein